MACGKDANCWQAPFSKMTMLKVKEEMVRESRLVFFIYLVCNMCVGLVVHQFKKRTQPLSFAIF